jgi:outer membrane receptor protein involved in Fe transport
MTIRIFFAAFCLLTYSVPAFSQTFRGGISGVVNDPSGAAVSGATVEASNSANGLHREATTSNNGEFTFPDLPLGEYDVTIDHAGFDKIRVAKVQVEVGKLTGLRLTLKVATQSQMVDVETTGVTIDAETSTTNEVIPSVAVQDMPLNGRDFTQLVKLAPGVNGAGSINGARQMQNNWQIDGADNNDAWHNAAAVNQGGVSGVAGTLLPIDAIDQFSVQTNANAEAGRNGGGSINMVIKSGTNKIHGTLYYFNRNDALAANTPFAPAGAAKPKLKNNQFGGSVGGPIVKNKLFYFLTYERQKFIVGNSTGATEPSNAWVTQATSVLQKYGIPVNPVSTNLLTMWPAYGRTGPATTQNFFSTDNSDNYSDNGIGKIDYVINSTNNLAFRYFVGTGAQTAPVGSPYHDYYQVAPSRMQNYSLVWNSVATPRFVAQTLLGVNYFKQTFNDFNTGFNPVALGLNTGVTSPSLSGAPDTAINGFDEIGLTPPLGRIDVTGHFTETMSYNIGAHQFRFGGEYRRAQLDVFYQRNARGQFSFDGTQGPWANDPTVSSNLKSLGDFLAGYVSSSSLQVGQMQDVYYMNSLGFFAQDTYKVKPNLTLTYGLRWEYFGPYYDHDHRFSTFIPGQGGIVFVGKGIDSLYPKRYGNVAPRFGFAYTPTPKIVVRGSYGIYYDQPALNAFGDNRPPNGGATGIIYNPAGPSPIFSTTRSNYTIVAGQPVFGNPTLPPPPYGVFSVDQGYKTASLQNFTLNTQYQLSKSVVAEVGYAGSLGHHLVNVLDINQPLPSTLGTAATRAAQNMTRPFYAQYPNYATINQVASGANSHYNGLLASIRTSDWHGLTSKFSYTFGHSYDDASAVRGLTPTDSRNLRFDYGNSSFDVRNTFTSYITYAVPSPSKGPKLLVRGWQLNSLLSFFSGLPYTVYAGQNISGTFESKDRVNVVGDPTSGTNTSITNGTVQWLNKAAFALPAPGTFGNEQRNQFYGPRFASVDFSVFKTTPITERISTQFRVEMFNLFNRTNLPNPNTTFTSGSFGQISSTIGAANGAPGIGAGEPFNVQLALKIIF